MILLSSLALAVGMILWIYGELRFQVAAYRWSVWWLFGCMFVPGVDWLFLLFYWRTARKPFVLSLIGITLAMLGACLRNRAAHS